MVSALVAQLAADHQHFAVEQLRVFMDRQSIATMDDWNHRIARGLRSAKVFLAVVSPAYLSSTWCRLECETYLRHEHHRALGVEGIAPVYIATAAAFEAHSGAEPGWIGELCSRQLADFRDWWPDGADALRRDDVRVRIEALEQSLAGRLERVREAAESPDNLPRANRYFAGRRRELGELRAALAGGRLGAVCVLVGLPGQGKTATALQYAHAFASLYPGGRWLVHCAGSPDLREPLAALAWQFGVELTAEERRDPVTAYARVRDALARGPRRLLILDNVDDPAQLGGRRLAELFPATDQLHVLATARVAPPPGGAAAVLSLPSLSGADGLDLLRGWRDLVTDEDQAAARGIVARLGGHALAVEVVAVFLHQHPEVSLSGYGERLATDGWLAVDELAEEVQLSGHSEASLGRLLEPTLAELTEPERCALDYAALLPADGIGLPWLRELVAAEWPDLAAAPRPGHPDAWRQIERRLTGLRLLAATDEPRVVSLHRLVGEVVRGRLAAEVLDRRRAAVIALAGERADALEAGGWYRRENLWEVSAVAALVELAWSASPAAALGLAHTATTLLWYLGRNAAAQAILERGVAWLVAEQGAESAELARWYSNLGLAAKDRGDPFAARRWLEQAIRLDERHLGPADPVLAIRLSNLAMVDRDLGDLPAAEAGLRRAVAIREQRLAADDVLLARSYINLAAVLCERGQPELARDYLRRAQAIAQAQLDERDPLHVNILVNLGRTERALGHPETAERLFGEALEADERELGGDHPYVAATRCELASVALLQGDCAQARDLLEHAVAALERRGDPQHPRLAEALAQLAELELTVGHAVVARALMSRAHGAFGARLGVAHPRTRAAADWLARQGSGPAT